ERALADLADPARRELVPIAVLPDEPRLLEELGHPSQLVERLTRALPRETLDLVAVDVGEVVRVPRAPDHVLHIRKLVHLIHEAERFRARLRSRIIWRVRSSCSGVRPLSESRMFLKYEPRTCCCSCLRSSWYFSAAFGSTNS